MPIIATNIIVGGKEINKEEPKKAPPPKRDPIPLAHPKPVSVAPEHIEKKFKKEHEQGLLFGHNINHSAYHSDMLVSLDND